MLKGKTATGFEFEVSEDIGNDYELVEQLSELEDNPFTLTKVIIKVLGKDQANRLKEHLRNDKGIVPADAMMGAITEIFTAGDETKNY